MTAEIEVTCHSPVSNEATTQVGMTWCYLGIQVLIYRETNSTFTRFAYEFGYKQYL